MTIVIFLALAIVTAFIIVVVISTVLAPIVLVVIVVILLMDIKCHYFTVILTTINVNACTKKCTSVTFRFFFLFAQIIVVIKIILFLIKYVTFS